MPQPQKKTSLEIMLEDAAVEASTPEQRVAIKALQKLTTPAFGKKVEARYAARLYSDQSISFNRIPTYNDPIGCALDELSGTELTVFLTLARAAIRGYLVGSSKKELAEVTGISRPTVGVAIETLIAGGYMAVHTPASGRRTVTIWMLNPGCIGNGKLRHSKTAQKQFNALAGRKAVAAFNRHRRQWQAVTQTITLEGEKVTYSAIEPYVEQEKEPLSAATQSSSFKDTSTAQSIPAKARNVNWETYPKDLPGQMDLKF